MKPQSSQTPNEIIDLTIDSLSYFGGRGVGRYQGVVVFVPFTAPGDVIRARITAKKSKFWEAEIAEVVTPSHARRTPPCAVAGRCGGCSWQHIVYPEQIDQKKKILSDSLRRLSGFEARPFLAAPEEFHYRNRIQLQIQGGQKGFFALRTRNLVAIDKCWIAEEPLNARMADLKMADLQTHKLELAIDETGRLLTMAGERDPEAALFSQVNRAQNEILKSETIRAISGSPDWIMDLYAGSGNLTEPLARAHPEARLIAVELSRKAVERGRTRLPAVEWHAGDVAREVPKIQSLAGEGLVVLDPPRVGCDQTVVNTLLRLRPRQILYISCNPSTFARDAERLVMGSSYRLEHVRGLDMFPQTEHIELLASFSREN